MQKSSQYGAALAVCLILLGMLTLVGVTAISMVMTNAKLVGNLQAEKEVEKALDAAVETLLSDHTPITKSSGTCDPPQTSVTVNGLNITVDLDEPRCLSVTSNVNPDQASSEVAKMGDTQVTLWEISGTAWDNVTGARVRARWGVALPVLTGNPICLPVPTGNSCS